MSAPMPSLRRTPMTLRVTTNGVTQWSLQVLSYTLSGLTGYFKSGPSPEEERH